MFFNHLLNNLIKSGNKERAFRKVYFVLRKLKIEFGTNPLELCIKGLKNCETRLELKLSNLMRFQKKKSGEVKIKGRLTHVGKMRAHRRAIKDLVKTALSRVETKLDNKICNELSDVVEMKGLTLKKKRDFYSLIQKIRPSVEVVKRRKRRKRINRF